MSDVDLTIKNTVEDLVNKFLNNHSSGGSFIIGGNSHHNKAVIDAALTIALVSSAEEIQLSNRFGKDIKITVVARPQMEISYDNGETWSKA
jgi:hypothetical protein